jgi:hypothetical protein
MRAARDEGREHLSAIGQLAPAASVTETTPQAQWWGDRHRRRAAEAQARLIRRANGDLRYSSCELRLRSAQDAADLQIIESSKLLADVIRQIVSALPTLAGLPDQQATHNATTDGARLTSRRWDYRPLGRGRSVAVVDRLGLGCRAQISGAHQRHFGDAPLRSAGGHYAVPLGRLKAQQFAGSVARLPGDADGISGRILAGLRSTPPLVVDERSQPRRCSTRE